MKELSSRLEFFGTMRSQSGHQVSISDLLSKEVPSNQAAAIVALESDVVTGLNGEPAE
jgi:hypothetical protein